MRRNMKHLSLYSEILFNYLQGNRPTTVGEVRELYPSLSRVTVQRILKQLIDHNYIERVKRGSYEPTWKLQLKNVEN